ncbi:MAG: polysaccharide biosynthesis C-terminal domain-containing protein, partial [Clostridia bacterium]|nr:polysaccharide biosynthesis C-terminal domain-containing protein [Clostridia bacterium]
EAYDMAVQYLIIYFAGAPGMLIYNFGAAILRTKGDTQRPLNFLIVAGVLNVLLNLLFGIVFRMNAAGVALATTLTQYLAAALTLRCLIFQTDETRLFPKKIRLHRDETFHIVKYGLPAGMTNAMFSIANIQIQAQINTFGSAAINGSGAVGNLEGYIGSVTNAFNAAVVAFAGQNIGAGRPDRVKKSFIACLVVSVAVSFALGNLMYLFGAELIRLFNASDPAVVTYGLIRGKVMLRLYFVYGFSAVFNGVLQAFGYSSAVMINSVVSIFGFRTIWMSFLYPANQTFDMLFWCYPISMLLIVAADAVILALVWAKYKKTGTVR